MDHFNFHYRKRKQQDIDEAEVLEDSKKFLRIAGDTLISQQALIMATSEDKGYNLDEYRQRVIDNMQSQQNKEKDASKCNEANTAKNNAKIKNSDQQMYGIEPI